MADAARERDASSTPSPPPRLEALGGGGRLTTPVARKADSIASQFQREILGELASKPAATQLTLRMDVSVSGGAGMVVSHVGWKDGGGIYGVRVCADD